MTMNRIALSRCVGLVELFLTIGRSAMPEIDLFPAGAMQLHSSKGSAVHFLLLCQFRHVARERFRLRLLPGHAGGHGWSGFAGAIKHPTNAKPVSKTAKITTPKHLLQRHFNLSAVRERLEETFRFRTRIRLKVDGNVVAGRESKAHGFRGICSHQHMTAQDG
jgi:hypothetical protein